MVSTESNLGQTRDSDNFAASFSEQRTSDETRSTSTIKRFASATGKSDRLLTLTTVKPVRITLASEHTVSVYSRN